MKISNTVSIMNTKFVNLMKTFYYDMNDDMNEWVWASRNNNRRAVVIAATYNNKLVLTKEFRIPLKSYEIGFPAGLIDNGETPEETARRELKEETGLIIDKIESISPPIYSSAGITNESVYMVICTAKGDINQDGNESSEDINTYLKTRTEVAHLLQDSNNMFGAKAYLLMQRFVDYGCLYVYKPLYI